VTQRGAFWNWKATGTARCSFGFMSILPSENRTQIFYLAWNTKVRRRFMCSHTWRINLADRVKTLVAAVPAISIRHDVLSEFSEPGIRFGKICPMTLDNVLDLIR
jgi:hypothetical protein